MLLARSPPTLACPASYMNTLWRLRARSTLCYQRAPSTLLQLPARLQRTLAYSSTIYPIRRALYSRSYYMCRPSLLLLMRSPRSYYMICAPCTCSPFRALLTHKLACSLPAPSATLLRCTEWLQTITPASNFGSAGFNTKLNRQRMLQCHWYDSGYKWRKTGSG